MRYCPTCGARFSNEAAFCPHDGIATEELAAGAEPPAEDPLVGQTLDGRYRIDEPLGEGGMGIVYAATHVVLGKRLAVKVLRREMARDQDVVQRFIQEAQAASSIGHPNIVDIHDFGHLEDGSVYFVMEHLDGEPLTELLAQGGSLPLDEVVSLVRQMASALGAAHGRGIVHRDLKPDNVFLVRRGDHGHFVKVLDFGVAKVGGAANKLTKTGVIFGTPHYMSPEQAAGQGVDQRTDVYALGVILYEMVTGDVPFDAETFMEILSKHMFEPPHRPSLTIAKQDLGALEPVILRALAKKADARYQSTDELVADLDRVQRGEALPPYAESAAPHATGAQGASARTGADVAPPLPQRRTPLLVAALAAAAVLLGTGVVLATGWLGSTGDGVSAASRAAPEGPEPEPQAAAAGAQADAGTGGDGGSATVQAEAARARRPTVALRSDPTGAQVVVEGAVVANTPATLPRPEGEQARAVELRLPGHEDQEVVLNAASPESMNVTLHRKRQPRRAARARRSPRPARDEGSEASSEQASGLQQGSGEGMGSQGEGREDEREAELPRPGLGSEVVDPWAE